MKYNLKINIEPSYKNPEIIINAATLDLQLQNIIQVIQCNKEKIIAYQDNLVTRLDLKDIVRIYSFDGKIYIDSLNATFRVKMRLKDFNELNYSPFIKISNSEIINVNYIKHLDISFTSTIKIQFTNETFTYVSRRFVKTIKERLGI